MTLNCVVHYSHLVLENQVVTPLKEATYSKLLEGRESRIALGGDHLHSEQCESVPSKLEVTKHGYHRQCYAKFTNAISKVRGGVLYSMNNRKKPRDPSVRANFQV